MKSQRHLMLVSDDRYTLLEKFPNALILKSRRVITGNLSKDIVIYTAHYREESKYLLGTVETHEFSPASYDGLSFKRQALDARDLIRGSGHSDRIFILTRLFDINNWPLDRYHLLVYRKDRTAEELIILKVQEYDETYGPLITEDMGSFMRDLPDPNLITKIRFGKLLA